MLPARDVIREIVGRELKKLTDAKDAPVVVTYALLSGFQESLCALLRAAVAEGRLPPYLDQSDAAGPAAAA